MKLAALITIAVTELVQCHNPEDLKKIEELERKASELQRELASKTEELSTKQQKLDAKLMMQACLDDAKEAYWTHIAINSKLLWTVMVNGKTYAMPPNLTADEAADWARTHGEYWKVNNVADLQRPAFDKVAADLSWTAKPALWESAKEAKTLAWKECELRYR